MYRFGVQLFYTRISTNNCVLVLKKIDGFIQFKANCHYRIPRKLNIFFFIAEICKVYRDMFVRKMGMKVNTAAFICMVFLRQTIFLFFLAVLDFLSFEFTYKRHLLLIFTIFFSPGMYILLYSICLYVLLYVCFFLHRSDV